VIPAASAVNRPVPALSALIVSDCPELTVMPCVAFKCAPSAKIRTTFPVTVIRAAISTLPSTMK
jgi:hypothetical protein